MRFFPRNKMLDAEETGRLVVTVTNKGKGDADFDGDREINVSEMKKYLKENVPYMARRLTGSEQNPVFSGDDRENLVTLVK